MLQSRSSPALFGFALFVGMMAAGYYYNLTFVQLGLEDFGTRVLGLSAGAVARDMAFLALLTCVVAIACGWWMQRQGWGSASGNGSVSRLRGHCSQRPRRLLARLPWYWARRYWPPSHLWAVF